MKITMLKLSTMAMTLLAIGLGVDLQSAQVLQQAQSFHHLSDKVAKNPVLHSRNLIQPSSISEQVVQSAFDPIIIPGRSVGPVTANTSHNDLVKIFESARLSDIEAPMGEGFAQPGTRVELGESRSFTIIWANADRTQVAEVRDIGSDWRTPEGIQPGLSIEELEAILGPFQLSGFTWDYGGTVRLEGTTLDNYDSQLIVRLQPTPEDTRQTQAMKDVLGDELLDSDHKSFDQIHPVVDEIIVSLAKPHSQRGSGLWW